MNPSTQLIVGYLLAAICAIGTIYGGYLVYDGHVKRREQKISNESKENDKETEIIQQDATGNDNIQAATTGDNSPIVGGDYVAGNQTVKYGPSLEDIKAAIREVSQEKAEYLHMEYGSNYTVGAITPEGFVGPKGDIPSGIEVKWKTGRVIHVSSERVQIVAPDIIVNTDQMKDGDISGNIFNLPKKIGAKIVLLKAKDFSVVIEVIGIDQNLVIVGLAMAPID